MHIALDRQQVVDRQIDKQTISHTANLALCPYCRVLPLGEFNGTIIITELPSYKTLINVITKLSRNGPHYKHLYKGKTVHHWLLTR